MTVALNHYKYTIPLHSKEYAGVDNKSHGDIIWRLKETSQWRNMHNEGGSPARSWLGSTKARLWPGSLAENTFGLKRLWQVLWIQWPEATSGSLLEPRLRLSHWHDADFLHFNRETSRISAFRVSVDAGRGTRGQRMPGASLPDLSKSSYKISHFQSQAASTHGEISLSWVE